MSDEPNHSRRTFLFSLISTCAALWIPAAGAIEQPRSFVGEAVFKRIMAKAMVEKWASLPIGDLIGRIARELEGTPYESGTLDHLPDKESCTVNLSALDCVTFFETTLAFARMLKKGGRTPADLVSEVRFTRYRGGICGDFTSRLHYTSDWFFDNQKKHVVKLLDHLPGSEPFEQKVGFMSAHPEFYRQLVAHPEMVPVIKKQEDQINSRKLTYIPMEKLKAVERMLNTGDIVGVCTRQDGLDIVHTGLVIRDKSGVPHFMDASSSKKKMKVTFEPGPISQAFGWSKSLTGAMFARPLEPALNP